MNTSGTATSSTFLARLSNRARKRTTLLNVFSVSKSRLTFLGGLRCLVGLLLVLSVGLATGHVTDAVVGAVGALVVGLISYEGLHRVTVEGMGIGALGTAVSAFVGSVTSHHLALLLVGLVLWGFIASLASVWGTAMGSAALFSVVVLVVLTALPASPATAAIRALWVLVGGLVETILVMAFWPLRGTRGEQEGIAHVLVELSRYAASHPGTAPQADHLLPGAESLADPNPAAPRGDLALIRRIYHAAEDTRILLSAMTLDLAHPSQESGVIDATGIDALADAAARLALVAEQLTPGRLRLRRARSAGEKDVRSAGDKEMGAAQSDTVVTAGSPPSNVPASAPALALLDAKLSLIEDLADQLTGSAPHARRASGMPHALVVDHVVSNTKRQHRLRAWWNSVVDAGLWGHATRLSIVLVAAMLVARLADIPNGYWIPMTGALVIRNDFTATLERSMGRILGTLVGCGLITAIAALLSPNRAVLVVAVAFFGLGVYSTSKANYGIYSMCMAATVVSLLALLGLPVGVTARERVVATAIGGGIALLVFLVWPVRKRRLQARALAALLRAEGHYAAAVLLSCLPGHPDNFAERRALAAQTRSARIKAKALLGSASHSSKDGFHQRARELATKVEIGAHMGLGLEAHVLAGDAPFFEQAEIVAGAVRDLSLHHAAKLERPDLHLPHAAPDIWPGKTNSASSPQEPSAPQCLLEDHLGTCPHVIARLLEAHVTLSPLVDGVAREQAHLLRSGGPSPLCHS
jgi:uncharacterized membrane protein YccC